ncbi:DUF3270 family protein [Lactococcus termiticola]|uniref:Uncharacterized protein n=1 Tax=Lactococcus termiticola TaxID=2169526 RepID=A0A2R5HD31_9LACT|nr:DUF3270 family protein [Lactococcus termiticola]GBG95984.1 hypothetical protein NtB2_00086 [Lactococcus termiticola]
MELRNLDDFYEKSSYVQTEERPKVTPYQRRVNELEFFLNITLFSMLLVIITYSCITVFRSPYVGIPVALPLTLVLYLALKSVLKKLLPIVMGKLGLD